MTSPDLIRQLIGHMAWADTELLRAFGLHADAATDEKLRRTLEHIVVVQRVFTSMLTGTELDIVEASQPVESLDRLQEIYVRSHEAQLAFVSGLTEAALDRSVKNPWMPELAGTVAEILMQVALHSQNHRGQCLTRLRELTGEAPTLDFIVWVKALRVRPAAAG